MGSAPKACFNALRSDEAETMPRQKVAGTGSGRRGTLRNQRHALQTRVLILAVCFAVGTGKAHASSIALVSPTLVHPGADSVDVPRNTRLWIDLANAVQPLDVTLTDARGVAVPLTVAELSAEDAFSRWWVATPQTPLEARTTFVVRVVDARGSSFGSLLDGGALPEGSQQAILSSFTTGDGMDGDPPPVPKVDGLGSHPDPIGGTFWALPGGQAGCPLFAVLDVASPGALVVVMARAGEDPLPDLARPMGVLGAFRGDHVRVGLGVGGGSPGCLEPHDQLKVGAWNATGTFSGCSKPFRVGPPVTADGCTQAFSSGSLACAVLLLALSVRRRRAHT